MRNIKGRLFIITIALIVFVVCFCAYSRYVGTKHTQKHRVIIGL